MTDGDLEQIKTELAALDRRDGASRRAMFRPRQRPALGPSERAELESLLAPDPEMAKLGKILERGLDARRKSLLAQRDQIRAAQQKDGPVAAAAFSAAVEARHQASHFLVKPYNVAQRILLDAPILIVPSAAPWDLATPQAVQMDLAPWRGSGIVPGASWLKIYLDTDKSPVPQGYIRPSDEAPDGGERVANFRFYFLWQNPYNHPVVANVSSALFFYGMWDAYASSGLFSGNLADLTVNAYLNVIRWSGWGDPVNQTLYPIDGPASNKSVLDVREHGGDTFGWLEGAKFWPIISPGDINAASYDMSAQLVYIPSHAVTLFEVGCSVDWWFHNEDGESVDDDGQHILLDLAGDEWNYSVQCPSVELELLYRVSDHPVRG